MKMSKYVASAAIAASAAMLIAAAPSAYAKSKKDEMTPLQLQAIQSRDIEGPFRTVFAAAISILQDSGYRVETANRDTGLITGVGSSKGKLTYNLFGGFGKSKKTPYVTTFIEEISGNTSRVRFNFVMANVKSNVYGSQPQDEEPIVDASVYQDAFEKLNQAVFIRMSMSDSGASSKPIIPAPAPAATEAQ